MARQLVDAGTFTRLEKKPNSFWCASDPSDVARVEEAFAAFGDRVRELETLAAELRDEIRALRAERSAPAPAIVRTSHDGTGTPATLCPMARCCVIHGVIVMPVCVIPSGRRTRSATSSS